MDIGRNEEKETLAYQRKDFYSQSPFWVGVGTALGESSLLCHWEYLEESGRMMEEEARSVPLLPAESVYT
jgi:hypothetical protein